MFCCPTPPVSSEACRWEQPSRAVGAAFVCVWRMGPVEQTQFVKLIHQSCRWLGFIQVLASSLVFVIKDDLCTCLKVQTCMDMPMMMRPLGNKCVLHLLCLRFFRWFAAFAGGCWSVPRSIGIQVGLQVCPSGTTYTWSIGCPTEPKACPSSAECDLSVHCKSM